MTVELDDKPDDGGSLKKKAAKGALWITLEMVGVQGTSFIVFATMAHFIGPKDFGLIGISFLAIQSLKMLVIDNIATAIARQQHATDIEYTTAFWITFGLSVCGFLMVLAFATVAEPVFHAAGLAPVLQAMSIIVLFMGLSRTHEVWLMRHFRFRVLALRGIGGALAGGVVGIALALQGYGVMALVGQQVVMAVVSVALQWAACPWRPDLRISWPAAQRIFIFLRNSTPNSIAYALNQNFDTFLVAFFFGPVSAGIFGVGKRVRLTLQFVIANPINGVTLPTLAEIQHDPVRLKRGMISALTIICTLCAPVFFGTSAVAHEAILVMFGERWVEAGPVLQWLAVGGFCMVLLGFNDSAFVMQNKPIWCFYVSISYSLLALLMFLLCVHWNMISLAMPFVLPYIVIIPFSAALLSRGVALTWRDWLSAMLPGIGASVLMVLMVRITHYALADMPVIIRLSIMALVGALTYALVLWLTGRNAALKVIELVRHALRRPAAAEAHIDVSEIIDI